MRPSTLSEGDYSRKLTSDRKRKINFTLHLNVFKNAHVGFGSCGGISDRVFNALKLLLKRKQTLYNDKRKSTWARPSRSTWWNWNVGQCGQSAAAAGACRNGHHVTGAVGGKEEQPAGTPHGHRTAK